MRRHYFISNNLDDLDRLQKRLENRGVLRSQIHVLTKDDAGVETREHLHNLESVLKFDIVHGTKLGAYAGFTLAIIILAIAAYTNIATTHLATTNFSSHCHFWLQHVVRRLSWYSETT